MFQANAMGNTGAIAEAGVKHIVDGRMSEKKNMQVNSIIIRISYVRYYKFANWTIQQIFAMLFGHIDRQILNANPGSKHRFPGL